MAEYAGIAEISCGRKPVLSTIYGLVLVCDIEFKNTSNTEANIFYVIRQNNSNIST